MSLWQDLRFAVRVLVKDKWFTLVAAVALALGIAANNAVFTFVNAVLIRGIPFKDAPRIMALAASRQSGKLSVRWRAADALSNIKKAEYSIDGGEWTVAPPVGNLSDSAELDYNLLIDVPAGAEHTIAVRVEDAYDNQASDKAVVR